MSVLEWYLCVAAALTVLGSVRLLLARDPLVRLICLNVAGGGALLSLVVLAARSDPPDPVPHALVLTGIVITVAFTGVGLVLLRRTEEAPRGDPREAPRKAPGQAPGQAAGPAPGHPSPEASGQFSPGVSRQSSPGAAEPAEPGGAGDEESGR